MGKHAPKAQVGSVLSLSLRGSYSETPPDGNTRQHDAPVLVENPGPPAPRTTQMGWKCEDAQTAEDVHRESELRKIMQLTRGHTAGSLTMFYHC